MVSLGSSGCPGTHYIDQVDLEFTEIHLPPPPKLLGLTMHFRISVLKVSVCYRKKKCAVRTRRVGCCGRMWKQDKLRRDSVPSGLQDQGYLEKQL